MDSGSTSIKNVRSGLKIIKPNFHLNYGKRRMEQLFTSQYPCLPLSDIVSDVFKGGFDKSYFIENTERSYDYISAQHMTKRFPKRDCKHISKKLTNNYDSMVLFKSQILVSCAGTIGNIRYVDEDLEGILGSQDIIRINPNDEKILSGYLFAFLSSKTCNSYLQSLVYGSVVPRIEPNALKTLPIPVASKELQEEIHNQIIDASSLRSSASKEIDRLIKEIEDCMWSILPQNLDKIKTGSISIRDILCQEKRIDAPYNYSIGRKYYNHITNGEFKEIGEIAEVLHPMLFGKKQLKGSEKRGNDLYKSSSMMKLNPETDFKLSKLKESKYEKLKVEQGWVLITRSGTVGNVVITYKHQDGIYIDDHMIRLIPKKNYSGILYLFLNSKIGKELIKFQKYGSVQEQINGTYIGRIPLPQKILEKDFLDRVQVDIDACNEKISLANELEGLAISSIENEIESWQKS